MPGILIQCDVLKNYKKFLKIAPTHAQLINAKNGIKDFPLTLTPHIHVRTGILLNSQKSQTGFQQYIHSLSLHFFFFFCWLEFLNWTDQRNGTSITYDKLDIPLFDSHIRSSSQRKAGAAYCIMSWVLKWKG